MNYLTVVYEVLNAVAAIATIAGFVLERWEKHKRQRMARIEMEETGGNRSL